MPTSIHDRRYLALRKHLKALRMAAGFTQVDIAFALEVDQSYVSKVERGERYMDVLFYLDWCRACGVALEDAVQALEKAGA